MQRRLKREHCLLVYVGPELDALVDGDQVATARRGVEILAKPALNANCFF
jgi:hypothetical protein